MPVFFIHSPANSEMTSFLSSVKSNHSSIRSSAKSFVTPAPTGPNSNSFYLCCSSQTKSRYELACHRENTTLNPTHSVQSQSKSLPPHPTYNTESTHEITNPRPPLCFPLIQILQKQITIIAFPLLIQQVYQLQYRFHFQLSLQL